MSLCELAGKVRISYVHTMSTHPTHPGVSPVAASHRTEILMLTAALGIIVFIIAASLVSSGAVQAADEAFLRSLRDGIHPEQPRGPGWISNLMFAVTTLGNAWFFTLAVTVAVGILAWRRNYRAMWLLIVVALGGWAILVGLKEFFARPRPLIVPQLIDIGEYSFPSGHAMMSAAIYVTIAAIAARRLRLPAARAALIGGAVLLSAVIGFSRAYLGVHYPSDIVAGWAAGLAWASVCWLGMPMLRRSKPVET